LYRNSIAPETSLKCRRSKGRCWYYSSTEVPSDALNTVRFRKILQVLSIPILRDASASTSVQSPSWDWFNGSAGSPLWDFFISHSVWSSALFLEYQNWVQWYWRLYPQNRLLLSGSTLLGSFCKLGQCKPRLKNH